MNILDVHTLTVIAAVVAYTVLLIAAFIRRSQQEKQTRWLLAFLFTTIIWEFLRFFTLQFSIDFFPDIPTKVLLVGTMLLGVTTAVYANWPRLHFWLLLSSAAILTALAIDFFLPAEALTIPIDNESTLTIYYTSFVSYLSWFVLSSYLLARTWREYRNTRFPWHANRLLFWVIALLSVVVGEALIFFNWSGLTIAGQITRFLGAVGLTYAVSSYRIFDVRTRAQRVLATTIITTISALPVVSAVLLVLWLPDDIPRIPEFLTTVFIAVIITLGIFFYQPFRNLVERFVYRYLIGEDVNTSQVVRSYSQAISRTLDMQQLSLVIVGTLSELLETTRGALILFTKMEDHYEIEPIPAMGRIPRKKIYLSHDSVFIQALQQHQPLLQYELDFNPDHAGLSEEEQEWLQELAMEVYVPISTSSGMNGLIAIGPKNSALPYQPGELELVQILADQTVVALQNARLYSELGSQNEKIRHLNKDLVSQNERLEIMDRVKSDFITIASHELRTPLTQVKGYSDILAAMNEENALTREQTREIVSHINRATLQLESLITAMLDASQLDVDGMQLTFVQTRLDTVLRLAVEPLIQAMRERRISLEINGVEELPSIYGDFKRLVQAFTNLIGNAVKYTPDHGSITVDAMLVPSEEGEEDYVEIVIADTGIGIDPKFHDLIFEKFFRIGDPQLHSTGSTKFRGAGPGLGLPIAKGVIEAHEGHIWVESEREDEERLPGSRFYIILPVQPAGAEATAEAVTTTRPDYLVG